jgi:nitrogen regulatory protein P-II 1
MTKKIEAIIREEQLDAVKSALNEIGIVGLNVLMIRGRGRAGGIKFPGPNGGSYVVDLLPKVQINIVLSDDNLEDTISAIRDAAYTGTEGDGVIFVYPVEDVIRISTGERGRAAITYQGDIDYKKERVIS